MTKRARKMAGDCTHHDHKTDPLAVEDIDLKKLEPGKSIDRKHSWSLVEDMRKWVQMENTRHPLVFDHLVSLEHDQQSVDQPGVD